MAAIEWEERFSVGVMRFDSQHRFLLSIINDFAAAMESGKGGAVLVKTLYQLLLYTKTHFAAEEQALEAYGFSAKDAHKDEHERMVNQLADLLARVDAGERPTQETVQFLGRWLRDHILGTDQAYAPFLATKRVT